MRGPAIAVVVAAALCGNSARAQPGESPGESGDAAPVRPAERVLLVAPPDALDDALEHAIRAALAGWPIDIVTSDGDPGSTMPAAARRARGLADQHDAGAVVWIGRDQSGHALWVFDRRDGHTVARPLRVAPPYDEPTAAAVALSAKTLLRHSAVAPLEERYGVRAEPDPVPPELVEDPAEMPPERPDPAPPRPAPAVLALETAAGARLRRTETRDLELRIGAGARFTPRWLDGWLSFYGMVRTGPGVPIDQPAYLGRFTDVQLSAGARAPLRLSRRIAIAPLLGGSVRFTEVDGSIRTSAQRGRARRTNPSLDGGLGFQLEVGQRVLVSAEAEMSYAIRRQIYLVSGEPVLTLPRIEAEFSLHVAVPIHD